MTWHWSRAAVMLTMFMPALTCAEETAWRRSWDATLYVYPQFTDINHESLLNPGNQVARLPETSISAEARANVELKSETLRVFLRPIVLLRKFDGDSLTEDQHEGYLSQWQARLSLSPDLNFSVGRDLLNWGPGQFRSPSSPFYFNNGRSNPMRELSGVDDLKLSWSPNASSSLFLARITGSGHQPEGGDPWDDSWLGKGELRGDAWTLGLALADIPGQKTFIGLYGQWTMDDAWLLYGEAGSGSIGPIRAVDAAAQWQLLAESPRRASVLAGATYTLINGQSLTAEYLWYGHGYDSAESEAYFERAQAAAALPPAAMLRTLGTTLQASPPLLNHDYLHLIWQNSLMAATTYWRLMYSHNLNDDSGELAVYGEHYITGRLSCFVLAVANNGGNRQEFGQFIDGNVLLGLRLAIP